MSTIHPRPRPVVAADDCSAGPPWRWPPLLKASLGLHAGASLVAIGAPASWPWLAGALVADHALIVGAGLWPRSSWLGARWSRLPDAAAARHEIALTIDDGPDPELTPRVLDLLEAHGAKATFFCIARHAAAHPALCREIVRRGHSVQNHSQAHSHRFSVMGPAAIRREVQTAQAVLADACGVRPRYFRAPAGLRNLFLAPILHATGLELVAWTRRGFDTVQRDPRVVANRLSSGLAAGDILLLHDHGAAIAADRRPVVLGALEVLLPRVAAARLRTVTLPEAIGTGSRPDEQRMSVIRDHG